MIREFVGNDIVDLTHPRCAGRAQDERFLSRVFHSSEVSLIRDSHDADRALWQLWAAKEAAFKVVSKLHGSPPPLVYARFVVRPPPEEGPMGIVAYEGTSIPFLVRNGPDEVHVIAWCYSAARPSSGSPPPSLTYSSARIEQVLPGAAVRDLEALRVSRFSERERPAVYSIASAAARIAARKGVASVLGVEAHRIEIFCEGGSAGRTPPSVTVEGHHGQIDVSLSHHGDWVAWAAVGLEGDRRPPVGSRAPSQAGGSSESAGS